MRASGEWTISSGRPAGTGSAGEACGSREPLPGERGLAAARRGQRRLALALEPVLDDPLGLAVPQQDERRVEALGDERRGERAGGPATSRRSPVSAQADHPGLDHGVVGLDRVHHGRRHVVVERQDHVGLGPGRGPGEVHRADVDVDRAEERARRGPPCPGGPGGGRSA